MKRTLSTIALNLAVFAGAAACITPFVWLLAAAFTRSNDIFDLAFWPIERARFTLDNFRQLAATGGFVWWSVNSMFVACASTVLVVLISALAAFGLAKFEFFGKRFIMGGMLLTMLVPGQVLLPGSYDLIWRLGWIDRFAALIVPASVNVLGVFLFRASMLAVPDDLLHAARVDGCGDLRLWWAIMLPSIRPMIGAFALLSFIGNWNSFLWPQIVLQDESKFTLPIGLADLLSQPGVSGYGPLMAGTLLSLIPVTILFFALQRDFVAGLTSAAVKG